MKIRAHGGKLLNALGLEGVGLILVGLVGAVANDLHTPEAVMAAAASGATIFVWVCAGFRGPGGSGERCRKPMVNECL